MFKINLKLGTIFILFLANFVLAQGQSEGIYQLQQSNVSCYVQNGSQKYMTSYSSLLPLSHYSSGVQRDYFQWNLSDEIIPDNSTINSVRIQIQYIESTEHNQLLADFFNIPYKLDEATATELWNATQDFSEAIGEQQSNNYTIGNL